MMKKRKKSSAQLTTQIDICLDKTNACWRAGEVIKGHVEVYFPTEVKVRAVKLHFRGVALVSWNEEMTFSKFSMLSSDCKNCETILDHTMVLLKKEPPTKTGDMSPRPSICFPGFGGQDEDPIALSPGKHRYQFEYALAQDLPSSFNGKWGSIGYSIKFTLERSMAFDLDKEKEIQVIGNLDLNEEPEIVRPIAGTWDFFPGTLSMWCCCTSGPINVEVRLRRKGFVLGETIPFYVEITNGSSRKLAESRVALVQHSMFRADDGSSRTRSSRTRVRRTSNIITQKTKGEILPGETYIWEKDSLEIPTDIIPSCMKFSKIIQVKYTLSVLLTPAGWNMDEFILPVYIVIGTVNLRRSTIMKYFSQIGLDFRMSTTSLNNTPRMIRKSLPNRNVKASRQSLPSFLTVPADINYYQECRQRRQSAGSSDVPLLKRKSSDSLLNSLQATPSESLESKNGIAKGPLVKKSTTGVKSSSSIKKRTDSCSEFNPPIKEVDEDTASDVNSDAKETTM